MADQEDEGQWNVRVAAGEFGPIDLETLRAWVREGRVTSQDLVLNPQTNTWALAAAVRELEGLFPPPMQMPGTGVPSQVRHAYPLAPHGARLGAYLLDGLFAMLFAVPGIVLMIVIMITSGAMDTGGGPGPLELLIIMVPAFLYQFLKDGLKGGSSWGKRICGLRVVHLPTGQPCTKGRSFLRHILYLVNCYGIVTLVEIVMVFANSQRRRVGDLIAGTMVIPAEATVVPQAHTAWPGRQWPEPSQQGQPLSGYPQQTQPPGDALDRQPPA